MAKVIWAGAEDAGKSYKLAEMSGILVERNAKWIEAGLPPRPIRSNLEFKPWFEKFAAERYVPIIYWRDIEEWVTFAHCDMICDEIGAYLDSRTFKDLPLDVRLWLAQASKLGVDIYGTAQDFAQVDLSFRRLVVGQTNALYMISKLIGSARPDITRPPVKRVWGIGMQRELDPVAYDEQSKKFSNNSVFPSFFMYHKEICDIFDTTKRIAKTKPPPYKHIERECGDPDCEFHRITHV